VKGAITKTGYIMNWAKTKLLLNYTGSMARDIIRMYLLLGDLTADLIYKEVRKWNG
jgi:hypothetical protein